MTELPDLEKILEIITKYKVTLKKRPSKKCQLSKPEKTRIDNLLNQAEYLNNYYETFKSEINEELEKGYRECCKHTMHIYRGHIDLIVLPEVERALKHAKSLKRKKPSNFDEQINYLEEELKKCEDKRSSITSNYYQNKFSFESSESPLPGIGHFLWKYVGSKKGHIGPSGTEV